ncbi:MAG: prepilin-type N-terminal cleavage/methylation domain-containing protein [Planctomycetes bacterium]|nr:prepilin-type N-terminal cleavage/methylation domain-containing protein [Planctomycetota bacterium]
MGDEAVRRAAPSGGFTLIELSIALVLASFVALGALAALDSIAQQGSALDAASAGEALARRGLARLEDELFLARAVRFDGEQLLLERDDGRWSGYQRSPGRTQLHRVEANDELLARAALAELDLGRSGVEPQLDAGFLPESAFRESALLLGMREISWSLEEREILWPRRGLRPGLERAMGFASFDRAFLASEGARAEEHALPVRESFELSALASGLVSPWIGARFRMDRPSGELRLARLVARRVEGRSTGTLELRLAPAERPDEAVMYARASAAMLEALSSSWSSLELPLAGSLAAAGEYLLLLRSLGGEGGIELRLEIARELAFLAEWRLDDGLAMASGVDEVPRAVEIHRDARLCAELVHELPSPGPQLERAPLALIVRASWSGGGAHTARLPLQRLAAEALERERAGQGLPAALPGTSDPGVRR